MASLRSLGILETRGMAALMGATDAMLKVADVSVCGRHGIGSGWVTVTVEGDVDAVEAALSVGRQEAAGRGEVIFAEVIARPDAKAAPRMPHAGAVGQAAETGTEAVGLLETRGMVPLIQGADAMAKAAAVRLVGWTYIGGALVHALVRGDVASVQTALDAGARAAAEAGELYATLVIPGPADGIGCLFPPESAPPPEGAAGALGVVETTGYVSAVGAADGAVKAADVRVLSLTIGSGGRVVTLFSGDLDGVQAAVSDGRAAAEEAGQLEAVRVLSRPDPATMALFGQAAPPVREPAGPHLAMGLIETRSTVALVKAVDRMLRAADVTFEGRYKVGYFLTAAVLRGDVGAVRAALEAGSAEAAQYGELVSAHLIPQPYAALEERLAHA
jgi:microcompartment protein CcmL/EutN